MRRGWNGITISRDTIHIEGIELGYKKPVFFERHAVGGEYGAGWNEVGEGTLLTTYLPKDGSPPFVVDKRDLTDENNVVVVYHVRVCMGYVAKTLTILFSQDDTFLLFFCVCRTPTTMSSTWHTCFSNAVWKLRLHLTLLPKRPCSSGKKASGPP